MQSCCFVAAFFYFFYWIFRTRSRPRKCTSNILHEHRPQERKRIAGQHQSNQSGTRMMRGIACVGPGSGRGPYPTPVVWFKYQYLSISYDWMNSEAPKGIFHKVRRHKLCIGSRPESQTVAVFAAKLRPLQQDIGFVVVSHRPCRTAPPELHVQAVGMILVEQGDAHGRTELNLPASLPRRTAPQAGTTSALALAHGAL